VMQAFFEIEENRQRCTLAKLIRRKVAPRSIIIIIAGETVMI